MTAAASWSNWAGDQVCAPALLEQPADNAAVIDAVQRAAIAGRTVRVAGAGHSFTDAVLTGGTLLTLREMTQLIDVDPASGLVRVQAGATLHELSEVLWGHGLAFENLGDIDVQTIAGATATGTHGTGAGLRNLSAGLQALQLVTGTGEVIEVDEAGDRDGWRAARVSVGALGVVTEVTFKAVEAFAIHAREAVEPFGTSSMTSTRTRTRTTTSSSLSSHMPTTRSPSATTAPMPRPRRPRRWARGCATSCWRTTSSTRYAAPAAAPRAPSRRSTGCSRGRRAPASTSTVPTAYSRARG